MRKLNVFDVQRAKKLVTHVRIIMNGKDVTYAVDNRRAGIYTLQELVTSAGGSLFSEYDDTQKFISKRNNLPSWIDPIPATAVSCEHTGLNYLSITGSNGMSVGEAANVQAFCNT